MSHYSVLNVRAICERSYNCGKSLVSTQKVGRKSCSSSCQSDAKCNAWSVKTVVVPGSGKKSSKDYT